MADPLLNEDYIRNLLSVPVNVENVDAMQAGAVQALIDLYDRKVTREAYCGMAASCITLYAQCSKLWMLHNVKHQLADGDRNLTDETWARSDAVFCELIRKQAEKVVEIVKRLQLCPTSEDLVH